MKPFITVVIPLYNKQNYVGKTLESVLNQSFTNFEVVLINDCSTDNSFAVVAAFDDSRIKLLSHSKNQGLSATRNTGIKNATSKYIALLDADDLWKPDFLKEIYQLITSFPDAHLFATNYEEIIDDKITILPANGAEKLLKNGLINDYFEISLQQPLYCPSSFCVKKEVFENIGFYNEKITYGEDVDFNIRANLVYKLVYSTCTLTQYHTVSENQITQSNFSSKKITDFDFYDNNNNYTTPTLKKYLDFQRYTHAKMYKMEGDFGKYNQLKKGINLSNLNWKQIILLHLPSFLLNEIKIWKQKKLKKGKRFTTYN
jgi:glycosyltransferase involved in cell wall biosynthesis